MNFFMPVRSISSHPVVFILLCCTFAAMQPYSVRANEPLKPALPGGTIEPASTPLLFPTFVAQAQQPIQPKLPAPKDPVKKDANTNTSLIYGYFLEALRRRNYPDE